MITVSFPLQQETHVNSSTRRVVLAGIVGLSLIATACGADQGAMESTEPTESSATESSATDSTEAAGELAAGEVFVTGSSTVEPITVLVGFASLPKGIIWIQQR